MTKAAASVQFCVTCQGDGESVEAVEGHLCAEHAERARAAGYDIAAGRFQGEGDTRYQVPGNQDQVGSKGNGRNLYVVPSSLVSPSRRAERSEPELLGLVRDYEAGKLEPVDVKLGTLPPAGQHARDFRGRAVLVTEAMHAVAADIRLLLGLRQAVDEDRPLPYSTRFCAERCGLRHHGHAGRVLRRLEAIGIVKVAGSMKPRGKPDGTKLYEAP
jgi:hypothetical protein